MQIDNREVKPMPGHVYIKLESLYKDQGLIHIPEKCKSAMHIIGRVVDVTMNQQASKALGFTLAAGDRLIMDHTGGRPIADGVFDYPIIRQSPTIRGKRKPECTILALAGDDVDLAAHSQELERCRWCGDAKAGISQSMLMMNGQCPRCHKNRFGEVIPTNPEVTVSDSEIEEMHELIYKR